MSQGKLVEMAGAQQGALVSITGQAAQWGLSFDPWTVHVKIARKSKGWWHSVVTDANGSDHSVSPVAREHAIHTSGKQVRVHNTCVRNATEDEASAFGARRTNREHLCQMSESAGVSGAAVVCAAVVDAGKRRTQTLLEKALRALTPLDNAFARQMVKGRPPCPMLAHKLCMHRPGLPASVRGPRPTCNVLAA